MRFLRIIGLVFKGIFNFKKPRQIHFEFIDVVIDDRPMLAVSWKIKNVVRIRFKGLKKSFWRNENGIILQIPRQLETVLVEFRGVWRRNSLKLELSHYKLDYETADSLIKNASNPSRFLFKNQNISTRKKLLHVSAKPIAFRTKNIKVRRFPWLKLKNLDY